MNSYIFFPFLNKIGNRDLANVARDGRLGKKTQRRLPRINRHNRTNGSDSYSTANCRGARRDRLVRGVRNAADPCRHEKTRVGGAETDAGKNVMSRGSDSSVVHCRWRELQSSRWAVVLLVRRSRNAVECSPRCALNLDPWASGDFNRDGRTNISDLALLQANLGVTASSAASQAAVPEPSGIVLLLIGLAGTTTRVRRRRRTT